MIHMTATQLEDGQWFAHCRCGWQSKRRVDTQDAARVIGDTHLAHSNLLADADSAYDRQDRAWFKALPVESLEFLWAHVSGPNLLNPAGSWDDEVFDALWPHGWFEANGVDAPGGPKDIWSALDDA